MGATSSLSPDHLVEEAVRQHRAGQVEAAERLYRRAITASPTHGEANHNLGIILIQRGEIGDAIGHFLSALASDQTRDLYWLSSGRAMILAGRTDDARSLFDRARSHGIKGPALDMMISQLPVPSATIIRPKQAHDLLQLGDALAGQDAIAGAIDAYEQALALDPDLAEAHQHLGSVLAEGGRIAEGFAHLMRRAELVHAAGAPTDHKADAPHRIKHDREQREYLAATGTVLLSDGAPIFHLGDGRRIDGPAVDRSKASEELLAIWNSAQPQLVVIDGFLTGDALVALRRYCAESTVWKRVYDAGYIGATPADGFACPLLAQIAEEAGDVYRAILNGHDFRYLGGFKYDSALSTGTNTHADFSAINLNLYITPDEANLDPESGGMIVWNVEPADEAAMRRYNGDEAAARAYIAASGATPARIAHRANRAVLFRSSLLHKTDACNFREGYLNKRINISLLYGDWAVSP